MYQPAPELYQLSTYPATGQVDTIWVVLIKVKLLLVVYFNQNNFVLDVLLKYATKIQYILDYSNPDSIL